MIQLEVRSDDGPLSFETVADIRARTPEAGLALAVLVDAVLCFRKYAWSTGERDQQQFREAQRWLSSDASPSSRFTCGFICDSLGIDRAAVTEGLRAWQTRAYIRRALAAR